MKNFLATVGNIIVGLLSIPFFLIYIFARWIREITDAVGRKRERV